MIAHAATRIVGQPLPLAVLAGAQLGVPVAAVTIGNSPRLAMFLVAVTKLLLLANVAVKSTALLVLLVAAVSAARTDC